MLSVVFSSLVEGLPWIEQIMAYTPQTLEPHKHVVLQKCVACCIHHDQPVGWSRDDLTSTPGRLGP